MKRICGLLGLGLHVPSTKASIEQSGAKLSQSPNQSCIGFGHGAGGIRVPQFYDRFYIGLFGIVVGHGVHSL